MNMTFQIFKEVVNGVVEFDTSSIFPETIEQYIHDWYVDFKEDIFYDSPEAWCLYAFDQVRSDFSQHPYRINLKYFIGKWIDVNDMMPPMNLGVLVFIPEEDNHKTAGMWDVSKEWVLLDENRVPDSKVTHWSPLMDDPK